jgi:chitodextrinase
MMQERFSTRVVVTVVLAALAAGCTLKDQEAPPLMGPSEQAISIALHVSPDILTQDGASQSLVRVTVRDKDGSPLPNIPLRTEIWSDGQPVDFGRLSARNVVTAGDGTATFSYTAPPAPPVNVDTFTTVDIVVMPTNSGDFNNSQARLATIRLVPPGVVQPPSNLAPHFTWSPQSPQQGQPVFFEACNDAGLPVCAPANNPVVHYAWDFGNGGTASGQTATQTFSTPGNYFVRLTITDGLGRSLSTTRTVSVGQSAAPTAAFVFSPTNPRTNQPINFNASASTAAAGRTIVSYRWDFGDGTIRTSGAIESHSYSLPRTYNVTLVVTDDIGRTGTTTVGVSVTTAIQSGS